MERKIYNDLLRWKKDAYFYLIIFKKQKKYPSKVAIPDKKQTKIFICITN